MTTYSWIINAMNCNPKEGSLNDIVVTVFYTREAIKVINDVEYTAIQYNFYECPLPTGSDFIPYEDLTYVQVCGWLNESMDVIKLDLLLDQMIETQINPPIVQLPLPWETPNI